MNDTYRVNLDVFEGPLDLLLYLIRKNDLDIYDIPIAFILEEYMGSIETMQELDIDVAGDFLLMASELMHIKSRMLLPDEGVAEEEEEADPRADLVRRLLEYQRYREAANALHGRSLLGRDVFVPLAPERLSPPPDGPITADMYDLIEAFGHVLARIPADRFHAVAVDRISVNQRIYQLLEHLPKGVTVTLDDLLAGPLSRYDVVVTFLALLEMSRLNMITLSQVERGGALYVTGSLDQSTDTLSLVTPLEDHHGTP